jgi:hypothetical protein
MNAKVLCLQLSASTLGSFKWRNNKAKERMINYVSRSSNFDSKGGLMNHNLLNLSKYLSILYLFTP